MLAHAPFLARHGRVLSTVYLMHTHHVRPRPSTSSVTQIYQGIRVRNGSTTSNTLYAFPTHPNPTPHQIFHLPRGASQHDVKARYYDLVRAHHPDSALARGLEPAEATRRFAAIGAAYDTLRGKSPFSSSSSSSNPWSRPGDDEMREELRRRARAGRAHHRSRTDFDDDFWHGHGHWGGHGRWHGAAEVGRNQSWKDWVIIIGGGLTFIAGTVPYVLSSSASNSNSHHRLAAQNLADARAEAKEVGAARRREIRRRVRAHELECAEEALERANAKGREALENEMTTLGMEERGRTRAILQKERERRDKMARRTGRTPGSLWNEGGDDKTEGEWLGGERADTEGLNGSLMKSSKTKP
ncbi:hypothetical protein CONPUDRAFT_147375 [Coniophora puteana RWD-64-598 SS2]|uniref:J domain-containing protein n=1 Tax=Coniophora puteana (strain RWD-64-598) TaxID=741705 RepID=A0A5M3M8M6_CONPW|nr:uncharacterized protein CONPUDRAFT_147375 [Coniophora puteana RWD-64-598 SS2]EIW75286.1 hypothetical protein CONPUDRAFT_147375 [Coniophora puteana RWD-64-598 SS2]